MKNGVQLNLRFRIKIENEFEALISGRFCCREITISGTSKLSTSVDGEYRTKSETSFTASSASSASSVSSASSTTSTSTETRLTYEHEKQTSTLFFK
jgi:hypothetical protein